MQEFNGTNHSLKNTLERLDFDPPVVAGLTGNELFTIVLLLQGLSLIVVMPIIGLATGVWILAFGISMIVGIVGITAVGGIVAKAKERRPADIVWLDYKLALQGFVGMKSEVFTKKEVFSCERMTSTKKGK